MSESGVDDFEISMFNGPNPAMDQNPQAKIGSRFQTLKNSPANFDSPSLPQLNPHFAGGPLYLHQIIPIRKNDRIPHDRHCNFDEFPVFSNIH